MILGPSQDGTYCRLALGLHRPRHSVCGLSVAAQEGAILCQQWLSLTPGGMTGFARLNRVLQKWRLSAQK